ncbi:MAG TPA: type II toxin-antitoxin system PemK/MazF family toxin [Conexibacter sp.]|jgi:mRNA interferase MazF|nr:type II toxin-antitoxin system PemK/MazF family toxin [Conexibacter sp.]
MTRGDVHRVNLPARRGREQHGPRYAVLVQAEELLGLSTVLVAPTSRSVRPASFRPEVEVAGERTRVMVEQMRALDLERLGDFAGRLSATEQRAVDEALELVLALR